MANQLQQMLPQGCIEKKEMCMPHCKHHALCPEKPPLPNKKACLKELNCPLQGDECMCSVESLVRSFQRLFCAPVCTTKSSPPKSMIKPMASQLLMRIPCHFPKIHPPLATPKAWGKNLWLTWHSWVGNDQQRSPQKPPKWGMEPEMSLASCSDCHNCQQQDIPKDSQSEKGLCSHFQDCSTFGNVLPVFWSKCVVHGNFCRASWWWASTAKLGLNIAKGLAAFLTISFSMGPIVV